MIDMKNLGNVDLYGLLGVLITATDADIRKAYRKKALECHPDKNPDNPKAAELFHDLSKALEILSDESARTAYNRVIEAKKAAELRNQQLDSKRQKLKADLEERERQANLNQARRQTYSTVAKSPEEALKDEIERLRKEGFKLLQEEQEIMQKHLQEERLKMNKWDSAQHRIKIKWNSSKSDPSNGGYTKELLEKFLHKYGDIVVLVMSPKKNGSALVEFKTQDAAEMAVSYEKGRMENPLSLEWVGNPPKSKSNPSGSTTISHTDYESLVLRQMRQAEERKRLIEAMLKEDQEES
ncbi:DnaJ like subfamily C member 17 [Pseudolycoriella hygida]|uniref:DnaJ homolog subfamily C member 17 n=1 Tax=Pseudolycoriella hygida TaxID=35572 RepID=A0A9Q0MQ31_9DIPT|nr:DnaJ like subfamily C member 17 [Pseudolycoriella hygida]